MISVVEIILPPLVSSDTLQRSNPLYHPARQRLHGRTIITIISIQYQQQKIVAPNSILSITKIILPPLVSPFRNHHFAMEKRKRSGISRSAKEGRSKRYCQHAIVGAFRGTPALQLHKKIKATTTREVPSKQAGVRHIKIGTERGEAAES